MTLGDVLCGFAADDIRRKRRMDVEQAPSWDELAALRRVHRETVQILRNLVEAPAFTLAKDRALVRAKMWLAQMTEQETR